MNKSNRILGIDIIRVISMVGIIGLHLLNQGGLIYNSNTRMSHLIILFLLVICYVSVNTFAILSGYLLWKKEDLKYKRLKELILTTIFYCIIISMVFYIFNLYDVRESSINLKGFTEFLLTGKTNNISIITNILSALFPVLISRYWYLTCYIFLYISIPYINKFISSLSKEEFKSFIIKCFVLLTCIQTIFFNIDYFKICGGYSPFWLIFCYFIGAYIGKFNKELKINKKKALVILLASILISYLCNIFIRSIYRLVFDARLNSVRFIEYISPFTLISASMIVYLFINVKTNNKKISKIFYYLGVTTFSVYIIHSHPLIYDNYFKNLMTWTLKYNILVVVGLFFIYMISIYLICTLIDLIRIFLHKILFNRRNENEV